MPANISHLCQKMTQIEKNNPTFLSIFLLKYISDLFCFFGGAKAGSKRVLHCSKVSGSMLYLCISDFVNIISVKIEAVDQIEIEAIEAAEESDPENIDEAGPSTSIPINTGTSGKLLQNSSHVHLSSESLVGRNLHIHK